MILQGIRVVDWTRYMAGPFAGAMLGDLGADVIHLEQRGRGDPERELSKIFGYSLVLPKGRQAQFEVFNRNKRSLAVDLNQPEGREVVYRLVDSSDVFLTNCRGRAIQHYGLDYETLSQRNPRLVYAHATGQGSRGPDRDKPSVALTVCARSGWMMVCGGEGEPPTNIADGIGDLSLSFLTAYGVMAALLARERGLGGQKIETSQLASLITQNTLAMIPTLLLGKEYPRHNRAKPPMPIGHNYYKTKDGRWVAIAAFQHDAWEPFCRALGMPQLAHDPRFDTPEKREENSRGLVALLDGVFASKSSPEWEAIFQQHDTLAAPIKSPPELLSDPQVLANDYIFTWEHPDLGPVRLVGFPVKFVKTPCQLHRPAPQLGEHTQEILKEIGYTPQEVERLRAREVI